MPKMFQCFNFPGEIAGGLVGFYTGYSTVYSPGLNFSREPRFCLCVCSNIFSETTEPVEAKFPVNPPWDRGRKFIQMVQVICCFSLLSTTWRMAGAFSRDFTINLSPQCRAFSRALKTEKLKALLFPGPIVARTTTDWCITCIL